ncbi:MAG: hypothetical protein ACYTEL_25605 [Planctomycetota bacterium]|jgi:tetratricopeptide (TPR) repeat protein
MDIRKGGSLSCRSILCLVLAGAIGVIAERVSFAGNKAAAEVLIATYKSAPALTTDEAELAVSRLEKTLFDCGDSYLSYRIKYRIGLLYFKAHMVEASKAKFRQSANDPCCPELVHIFSFNMIGQISRLTGKNREALEAFEQVAGLLEKRSSRTGEFTAGSVLARLWCSALVSKAEIYELAQDYAASITEYNRLLHILSGNKDNFLLPRYAPLLNDRMSQLHLRQRNLDKYLELAEALTTEYPQYYRTPIVKLEIECVKYLTSAAGDFEFVNGSFSAPAHAIARLKSSMEESLVQRMVDMLDGLRQEYRHTAYGGFLLHYHYARLLDSLGAKDKAIEVLAPICSAETVAPTTKPCRRKVMETVQEYARVQSAIMLGERADYKQASRRLGSLRVHPDESHILQLAKSVRKSLETLKREVYTSEKE